MIRGPLLLCGHGVLLVFVMTAAVYAGFYPFSPKMAPRGVQYDRGVGSHNYGARDAAEGTTSHGFNWKVKMMTKSNISCNHWQ